MTDPAESPTATALRLAQGIGGRPTQTGRTLPPIQPFLLWFFRSVARRRLRKSFRALRLSAGDALQRAGIDPQTAPLVVYLNHPSWWDPLTGFTLATHLFGNRPFHAPMDAEALERYRLLGRVGMFPVAMDSPRGAAQFLHAADAVLAAGHLLALTPQGHFADPRERPLELRPGLAALLHRRARRGAATAVLPIALEYTFWDQRLPEALARCGEPLWVHPGDDPDALPDRLRTALEIAMDELAALAAQRSPQDFVTVLEGRRGSAGFYALWENLQTIFSKSMQAGDHHSHSGKPSRKP